MRRTKLISREDTYLYSTYALLAFVCIRQIINIINAGKKGYGISELFLMYTSLNVVTVELITWMVIIVVVFLMWYIPHRKRQSAIKYGEPCTGEVLQVRMVNRGRYSMYEIEIDYHTANGIKTLITTLYYNDPKDYIPHNRSCIVYFYKDKGYLQELNYQEYNMNATLVEKFEHARDEGIFSDEDVSRIKEIQEEIKGKRQRENKNIKKSELKYSIDEIATTSFTELPEIRSVWRRSALNKQKRYIRLVPQMFEFISRGVFYIFTELEIDTIFSYSGLILVEELDLFAKRYEGQFYRKDAPIVERMAEEYIRAEMKKKFRFVKVKNVKVVIVGIEL